MTEAARVAAVLAVSFLLGAFPSALLVSRRVGVDLRTVGSGNLGATNVYRVLGPRLGLSVLAADMAKGALAVVVARAAHLAPAWLLGAAGAAVLGHMLSPFMHFRGGKGVAAGAGAVLGLAPVIGLLVLAVFAVLLATTRLVSLSSIGATLAFPVFVAAFGPPIPGFLVVSVVIAALVVFRHRANIVRLVQGKENRFDVRGRGGGA